MRTRSLFAVAVAGAVTLGGATTLALGANEPKPAKRPTTRAAFAVPPPFAVRGAFLKESVGFDRTLGAELAKELGMEEDKVNDALRKILEARLNAHRDNVLRCFDDPARCDAVKLPELALPSAHHIPFPMDITPRVRRP